MRRVAQTLGVSRSQLHERLRHGTQARRAYRKGEDPPLLEGYLAWSMSEPPTAIGVSERC